MTRRSPQFVLRFDQALNDNNHPQLQLKLQQSPTTTTTAIITIYRSRSEFDKDFYVELARVQGIPNLIDLDWCLPQPQQDELAQLTNCVGIPDRHRLFFVARMTTLQSMFSDAVCISDARLFSYDLFQTTAIKGRGRAA
jgi:hypothetical protein